MYICKLFIIFFFRLPCTECELFSKIVQSCIPGLFSAIALLSVIFFYPCEFRCVCRCISIGKHISYV